MSSDDSIKLYPSSYMGRIRKLLRPGRPLPWLLLSSILVILPLWMVLMPNHSDTGSDPGFSVSQLEYGESDGSPEDEADCSAILRGDSDAVEQAKVLSITKTFVKRVKIPDDYYVNATQDCRKFKTNRKYLRFPLSKEEEHFPLAFSLIVHHKVQNFERLLRAIYTPQNTYCVHVDTKAEASVHTAVKAITSCFPNVFMVSQPVSVIYASWSRVQADLNCMADLYNNSSTWKYFINLCGQDFPLKTNLEMVRSLRMLRGGNSMESERMPDRKKWRVTKVHQIVDGVIKTTDQAKEPPPFNLPILSGNAYIVASRGYVRSLFEDRRVKMLIQWANDTHSPDEFLWATIQRIPGVPGSTRPNAKYDMTDVNAMARLVKWELHEGQEGSLDAVYPVCHGRHVRTICVYGAGDLQWLLEQHHLFANKFDTNMDPIAVRCLEKHLRNKALAEIN